MRIFERIQRVVMSASRALPTAGISVLGTILLGSAVAFAQGLTDGPSAFCHVTDGAFASCADGSQEWSDITGTPFAGGAVLYVDQADLNPSLSIPNGSGIDTLMLMYDETQRTVPLSPGESVHVHFMTVDELRLVHYDVLIGAGGIQEVRINGVVQDPMPSGLAGSAGYGTSPNSAAPHVVAEFQIGLEAAGFTSEECCYSPDPAWWSSDVPPDPVCPPGQTEPSPAPAPNFQTEILPLQLRGCEPQKPETTTAGVFTANLDGSTTVDPQPLLPPGTEPPLCESIGRIVDFRVPPTGTYRNHGDYVNQVAQLAEALVQSQVTAGIITAEEAVDLQSCVVNPRARSLVGK